MKAIWEFIAIFFKIYIYLFGCAGVLAAARRIVKVAADKLSCSVWDLVPRPGIKPGAPALGAQSPSHWTTREVPHCHFRALFLGRAESFQNKI